MKAPPEQGREERIKAIVDPILSSLGLELVEVQQKGGHGRGLLRVFIDKPGGVTVEDCERASVFLGHALDVEDPIPFPYTLEVSSPGLDRPLKSLRDFQRAIGRRVRIALVRPREGQQSLTGELVEAVEDRIWIEDPSATEGTPRREILFADIQEGYLDLKW